MCCVHMMFCRLFHVGSITYLRVNSVLSSGVSCGFSFSDSYFQLSSSRSVMLSDNGTNLSPVANDRSRKSSASAVMHESASVSASGSQSQLSDGLEDYNRDDNIFLVCFQIF